MNLKKTTFALVCALTLVAAAPAASAAETDQDCTMNFSDAVGEAAAQYMRDKHPMDLISNSDKAVDAYVACIAYADSSSMSVEFGVSGGCLGEWISASGDALADFIRTDNATQYQADQDAANAELVSCISMITGGSFAMDAGQRGCTTELLIDILWAIIDYLMTSNELQLEKDLREAAAVFVSCFAMD